MIQDVIKKIDEIAEQEPDRVVYDYLGKTNTYGDLKKRSNAWAHKIASLDISDDAPIMIWGGQTFEMIASFLGCVKTGHAYIPIASYSNAERLTMIQDVSKSPLVLEIDPLPDVNLDNVKVLKTSEVEDGDFTVDESKFVEGDENYYIIFTSGTTGKPVIDFCNHMSVDDSFKELAGKVITVTSVTPVRTRSFRSDAKYTDSRVLTLEYVD